MSHDPFVVDLKQPSKLELSMGTGVTVRPTTSFIS